MKNSKYNFDFSPSSYFEDLSLKQKRGSKILGERRRNIAMEGYEDDFFPTEIIGRKFDESFRTTNAKILGPQSMGGEYLPFDPNEVEICRVVIKSTTGDVESMRVKKKKGKYLIRVVGEYEEDYFFKIRHFSSDKTLSMRQVIENIDFAEMIHRESNEVDTFISSGLVRSSILSLDYLGIEKREEIKAFVSVKSLFYPELEMYYEDQKDKWIDEMFATK